MQIIYLQIIYIYKHQTFHYHIASDKAKRSFGLSNLSTLMNILIDCKLLLVLVAASFSVGWKWKRK